MPIELFIQATRKDLPRRQVFDEPVLTVGRDPSSVLRFDMGTDLEVSTRHAEIRRDGSNYFIADRGSTNGTSVNGAKLRGERRLYPGDVINLGRSGPELRVAAIDDDRWMQTTENPIHLPPVVADPSWKRNHTREWLVDIVEARTRALTIIVVAGIAVVIALGLGGWLYMRSFGDDAKTWSDVTAPVIRKANDDAVVLIETKIPGQACARGCEGTGFSIAPSGLIATNRHVVLEHGVTASSIRVKFANTGQWVAATVAAIARDSIADVALVQVSVPGRYPAVVGLSAAGPDLPTGSAVMTIGFPYGSLLKMEGEGSSAVAKTTMTTGSIGKDPGDLFQIDAFADHGSSGSPVFDRHGHAIGLVASGLRDAAEKIIYVVPSSRIIELQNQVSARR